MNVRGCIGGLALALLAAPSYAQQAQAPVSPAELPPPPPEPLRPTRRDRTEWYGLQTLTADVGAVGFLIATAASDNNRHMQDGFAIAAVSTYLLGGPFVHAAHDNWGRAMGSFAIRAGSPFLGAAIGGALEDCRDNDGFCGLEGIAVGFVGGIVAAVVVDSAALARESVVAEPRVMPTLDLGPERASVGVVGRF